MRRRRPVRLLDARLRFSPGLLPDHRPEQDDSKKATFGLILRSRSEHFTQARSPLTTSSIDMHPRLLRRESFVIDLTREGQQSESGAPARSDQCGLATSASTTSARAQARSRRRERSSSAGHVRPKHDHLGRNRAMAIVAPTLKIAEVRWASRRSRHVCVVARGRAHLYQPPAFAKKRQ